MKAVLKVLLWLGLGGGIGYFAGYNIADNRRDKELAECCNDCQYNCDNCEAKKIYDEAIEEYRKENKAEEARKDYEGVTVVYNVGEAATDATDEEEPEMPEEKPEIGDEDIVGTDPSPVIEFITEEEYYQSDGDHQNSLIFYTGDKRIWCQDTNSEMTGDEILRSLGSIDGDGVGRTYFWKDAAGNIPGERFVRNNFLGYVFRIDRVDGNYEDEHEPGATYEEEDG